MPTKSKVSRSVRTGGKSIPPNLSRHTRLLQEDPVNIQPRYARIAQALIEEIAAGKFPVGALIATEAELCERFEVSRNTARAALAILSDMGLVTRHAGIGTFVRSVTAD